MNTSDFSAAGSTPGMPPGEPPTTPVGPPDKVDEFFSSIRRTGIVRAQDRWIGGVASGIALRLGVDALLIRAAFGVLFVVSGIGGVLYALGWALLPEQADGRIHFQEAIRGRFDSALVGAAIVFVIGMTSDPLVGWWGDDRHFFGGMVWVALTVFAVYVLVTVRNQRREQRAPAGGTAPGAPTVGVPYGPNLQKSTPASEGPTHPGAGQSWQTPGAPVSGPQVYGATWDGSKQHTRPPRRSSSAGATYVGAVIGASLLVSAALLLADRYRDLSFSPWLVACGVGVILTGAAIVVAGARGKSSGALGFLAIVAILVGAPLATVGSDGVFIEGANRTALGSSTYVPITAEDAEDGYAFGLGDITLDLTTLDLPPRADRPVTVPIEMGAGNITVVLAEGASASARVTLGAGQVYWQLDGINDARGGVGTANRLFETQDVRDGATPDIHLVVKAGAGEVFIKEES